MSLILFNFPELDSSIDFINSSIFNIFSYVYVPLAISSSNVLERRLLLFFNEVIPIINTISFPLKLYSFTLSKVKYSLVLLVALIKPATSSDFKWKFFTFSGVKYSPIFPVVWIKFATQ